MRNLLFTFLLITLGNTYLFSSQPQNILSEARDLFYKSIENKDHLEPAIQTFNDLLNTGDEYEGIAYTYIGALTALKAKYTFWPHDKLKYAHKGLDLMESGISKSENNIESLFIYGSTCYYLPFFFERGDDAHNAFKKIAKLLPEKYTEYDPIILLNVIDFLIENATLTDLEKENVLATKTKLKVVLADNSLK